MNGHSQTGIEIWDVHIPGGHLAHGAMLPAHFLYIYFHLPLLLPFFPNLFFFPYIFVCFKVTHKGTQKDRLRERNITDSAPKSSIWNNGRWVGPKPEALYGVTTWVVKTQALESSSTASQGAHSQEARRGSGSGARTGTQTLRDADIPSGVLAIVPNTCPCTVFPFMIRQNNHTTKFVSGFDLL